MGFYRKKPLVIEAVQFAGNWDEIRSFVGSEAHIWANPDGALVIPTLEGEMIANPGDWIIRGVKRELYPCKDDIFQATYEPAEE